MAVSLNDTPPSQGPICPVCFRDYCDSESNLIPRILQCGHTYCTECLERLLSMEPEEDEFERIILNIRQTGTGWAAVRRFPLQIAPHRPNNELKCPTCNGINRIYNRDISSLTKNFALLSCRPQNSQSQARQKSKVQHYCEEHDHDKRIYCNDCKSLVCAYCQLYGEHKKHNCTIATDVGKEAVDALLAAKSSISSDLEEVTKAEEQVSAAVSRLERRERRTERKVISYFASLTSQLEQRKNDLLTTLRGWSNEQLFILQAQLDTLQGAKKDCETMLSDCRELTEGDPLDALTQQEDVLEEVESLHSCVSGLSFRPLIEPTIRCQVSGDKDVLLSSLAGSCRVTYDAAGQREADGEGVEDGDSSSSEEEEGGCIKELGATRQSGAAAQPSASTGGVSNEASSVAVQDTQDPATTLDFANGIPKLEPAGCTGAAISYWYGMNSHAPPQPLRMPFDTRQHLRHHSGAEATEETLRPSQAMNTENTTYMNPIAPKPRLTNLFSSVPRPTGFLDSSDSEDESYHSHLLNPHPPRIPLLRPRSTALEPLGHNPWHLPPLFSTGSVMDSYAYGGLEDDEEEEDRERENGCSIMAGTITTGTIAAHIDSDSIGSGQSPCSLPPSSGDEEADGPIHLQFSNGHEDELVIPPSRQYSWTTDTSNGRSLMLEIDHNGTSVVQLSIQAQTAESSEAADLTNLDMDLTDLEEAEDIDRD